MQINFQNKTILIVDDIATNRVLLSSLLEDEGYSSIYEADSALQAYSVLQNQKIDLILLDVMMPDIDGVEACKHIREDENNSHIPIIMVTADDSDETLSKSFEVGANDYVIKPLNATNLKVRMANIFLNAHKDTIIQNQNRLLAVNETVQMLAHQWRQPLSAIGTGILSISVKNEFDTLDKESLTTGLNSITSNVQKLSKTLDEFRDIISSPSKTELLDINELVKASLTLIQDRFQENDIQISTDFQSRKNLLVFQNELINILLNIYVNSLEAFNAHNEIKARKVHLSTSSTQKFVTINIEDNAGGIEESLLKNIFEPYVSSKYQRNGVGLGLYNAFVTLKNLMRASISIESMDDVTTVSIVIPVTSA